MYNSDPDALDGIDPDALDGMGGEMSEQPDSTAQLSSPDDVPPLEDMSDVISMSRQARGEFSTSTASAMAASYDRSVQQNKLVKGRVLMDGQRVLIVGLKSTPQHNGKLGIVQQQDGERYVVKLEKSMKVLKVRPENLEEAAEVDAVKTGFLQSKPGARPKCEADDVLRPSGKAEGVLDDLQNLKIEQNDVPEWMRPSEGLLNKVASDKDLASGAENPKLLKAVDEIAKNPMAWQKYKDDPEVAKYFSKMLGVFGDQFREHEETSKASDVEEIKTKGAKDADMERMLAEVGKSKAAKKKEQILIQEAKKAAAEAKKDAAAKPKPQHRPGTIDYSKFDLDSDEEDDELLPQTIPPDDPEVQRALADPEVQRTLMMLQSDPAVIERLDPNSDLTRKLQLLVASGVIKVQKPGS
jgi:hypothetical protein